MTEREKELYEALKEVTEYLSSILSMSPDEAIDSLVNNGVDIEERAREVLYKERNHENALL